LTRELPEKRANENDIGPETIIKGNPEGGTNQLAARRKKSAGLLRLDDKTGERRKAAAPKKGPQKEIAETRKEKLELCRSRKSRTTPCTVALSTVRTADEARRRDTDEPLIRNEGRYIAAPREL